MISRLQKRCFVTSALVHTTLAAVLLLVPAFRDARPTALGEGPPLEMMPGELIDAALAPGFLPPTATEAPPAQETPAPPKATPPPKTVPPPEPEPEPEPVRTPAPKTPAPDLQFDLPKAREPGFTLPSSQLDTKTKDKDKRPERETPKIDLSKIKSIKPTSTAPKDRKKPVAAEPEGPSAEDLARARRQEIARSLDGASGQIAGAVSRGTVQVQIGPPGGGGGGGGGTGGGGGSAYAWHVRNAFNNAWIAPQNVKDDLATADVEVVIRRDGHVVRAKLVKRSGIAALDRSVQESIDRVHEIVPFEAGATEDQRTYTIGFNLRAKRSF